MKKTAMNIFYLYSMEYFLASYMLLDVATLDGGNLSLGHAEGRILQSRTYSNLKQ